MTFPAIGPRASMARGSSETMARNSAFVGHSESGSFSICPGRMRLFVSAALGNITATNSTAPADWLAAAASTYTSPGLEELMRTVPRSTEAVTECPRLRPSNISFSICLGLNGLSGVLAAGGGAGSLACCITCGAAASCARWGGTASGFFPRRRKNAPPAIIAMSMIPATAENARRRFLVGREAVGSAGVAATVRSGIITVRSSSSGCGVTLIDRVSGSSRDYSPLRVGRHFSEQAAEGRQAVGAVERAQHCPDRRLVRGHHRLLEFPLPGGNRRHRREIASGHHERLDLRPIDPGERIAGVVRAELPDRIRVGRAKPFERDRVEPMLRLVIAGGAFVDRIRIGRHDGDAARAEG